MAKEKIKLPKLPRGMGSYSWRKDGVTINYRKTVNGERLCVYGKTIKECNEEMKQKEAAVAKKQKKKEQITLGKGIWDWLEAYKKPVLKDKSYDAQANTILHRIIPYPIAKMQIQAIDADDIQGHINQLIKEDYSYSSVSKAYMALNQYLSHYYRNEPLRNPMLGIKAPTKGGMNVQEKEIIIMDDDDIALFVKEATRLYGNGKPVHKYGYALAGVLFTGIRRGEALGLKWSKFNFEHQFVRINEALYEVTDWEAPLNADGTRKRKRVSTSPKSKAGVRNTPLEDNALHFWKEHKRLQDTYYGSDEYVFSTANGTILSERNITRSINIILDNAGTKVQNSGMHMLRHTFISFLCREIGDKKVIAEIVGHEDTKIVERIYQHVLERQKIEAVKVSIQRLPKLKTFIESEEYEITA